MIRKFAAMSLRANQRIMDRKNELEEHWRALRASGEDLQPDYTLCKP